MPQPKIFGHFKNPDTNIAWTPLGNFPTPVERLQNLEKEMGLKSFWIKRDDLSGELYGGNKVRPMEFLLADALHKQADLILSYSALGSSWPLACTVYAKLKGLETDVFFMPYPLDSVKRKNLEVTQKLASHVHSARSLLTFPFLLSYHYLKAKKKFRVYLMPPGGSSPITTLGYVSAILELKQQHENGELPIPDFIFCAYGSGGTTAGISIGLNLIGWQTQVISVRVVDYIVANKIRLNRLIRKTLKVLQKNGVNLSPNKNWFENVTFEHGYFGKGYGRPLAGGEESIRIFAEREQQLLDSTYTGKTFAAILDFAKQEEFKDKNILFWQTLNSRDTGELSNKFDNNLK